MVGGGAVDRLRVTEVFLSLQGESRSAGFPTGFIRLTGCPLRCGYCDTAYAFTGGEARTVAEILADVEEFGVRHVCVTGGEPLAQRGCLPLLAALCDAGYEVSLETSGSLDISGVDPRVSRVMDIKTPGSGEAAANRWENIDLLAPTDQIKFVVCGRDDYEWSKSVMNKHELADRCEVLFSPGHGRVEPRELADWILADRLPARFQIQLHKLLWGDARGR